MVAPVRELLKPGSDEGGPFSESHSGLCPEILGVYLGVACFLLAFGWETYGSVVVRRLTSFRSFWRSRVRRFSTLDQILLDRICSLKRVNCCMRRYLSGSWTRYCVSIESMYFFVLVRRLASLSTNDGAGPVASSASQLTAFFTSEVIFASSVEVNVFNA